MHKGTSHERTLKMAERGMTMTGNKKCTQTTTPYVEFKGIFSLKLCGHCY